MIFFEFFFGLATSELEPGHTARCGQAGYCEALGDGFFSTWPHFQKEKSETRCLNFFFLRVWPG